MANKNKDVSVVWANVTQAAAATTTTARASVGDATTTDNSRGYRSPDPRSEVERRGSVAATGHAWNNYG